MPQEHFGPDLGTHALMCSQKCRKTNTATAQVNSSQSDVLPLGHLHLIHSLECTYGLCSPVLFQNAKFDLCAAQLRVYLCSVELEVHNVQALSRRINPTTSPRSENDDVSWIRKAKIGSTLSETLRSTSHRMVRWEKVQVIERVVSGPPRRFYLGTWQVRISSTVLLPSASVWIYCRSNYPL